MKSYFYSFLHKLHFKKIFSYGIWFWVLFFSFWDITFAQWWQDYTTALIAVFDTIIRVFSSILWLLTFLVSLFLHPEWTSGSFVGLGWIDGGIRTVWVLISNVVYFVFAMIFLWIAFANITGIEADTYQLKTAIPRFIVWVLMVPFSWFFVSFILSISSWLTVWVLSLPYDTFKDTHLTQDKLEKIEFCKNYTVTLGTLSGSTLPIWCDETAEKINMFEILSGKNSENLYGIINIYTYGVMSLDSQWKIYANDLLNWVNTLKDLSVKVIFDVLFFVTYGVLMIALALALFIRGVYLWFYMIMSPAFWLLFFFKKSKEWVGSDTKFSITEFIALAFVPVYVSAALAFWLLFLFSAGNADPTWINKDIYNPTTNTSTFAWISIKFDWPSPGDAQVKEDIKKLIGVFQGGIWSLLLQLFGLAILWVAVMAAFKQSSVTQNVVSPFADFGKSIWGLMAKAPSYLPIIPTGSGAMSASQLWTAGQAFKSSIESDFSSRWAQFWQAAAKAFWFGDENMNKLKQMALRPYSQWADTQNGIRELLANIDPARLNESGYRKQIWEVLKRLWAKDTLITEIQSSAKTKEEFGRIMKRWLQGDNWERIDDANQVLSSLTDADITASLGTSAIRWGNAVTIPDTITQVPGKEGEYKVKDQSGSDVTINVTNQGKGLTPENISALAFALQGVASTEIDDVLTKIWIKDRNIQNAVEKKYDEYKNWTPWPTSPVSPTTAPPPPPPPSPPSSTSTP